MGDERTLQDAQAMTRRRTVLFLSDETDFTGATMVLLRVMRGLDRRRFAPAAFINHANVRLSRILREEGIPCSESRAFGDLDTVRGLETGVGWRKTSARLAAIARLTPALVRCIRGSGADLLHANNYPLALYCAPAAVLTRTPFVFHDHNLREIRPRNWLNYKAVGWLCSRTVVVSEACRRNLAAAINTDKIVVVRNGVELPAISTSRARDVRVSLGIEPAAPLLAIIGQPREEKGVHVFIEAAAAIVKVIPAAKFLIVGYLFDADAYQERLRGLTDRYELQDHVIFTGWRDDIPDVVSAIDLLVHCRLTPEPAALVLIEAMAAGKPVVVSDTGGSSEIVLNNVTGKVYPPGDARALATAVIELLQDRDQMKQMGIAARKRVESEFTEERQVEEFEDLYQRILQTNR
jgi:glycosyltransferase involved in cell wall biosynthesis